MMKSKHFDSIIMDDVFSVTPKSTDAKVLEHAKAVEKMLNFHTKKYGAGFGAWLTSYPFIEWNDPLAPHIQDLFDEAEQ